MTLRWCKPDLVLAEPSHALLFDPRWGIDDQMIAVLRQFSAAWVAGVPGFDSVAVARRLAALVPGLSVGLGGVSADDVDWHRVAALREQVGDQWLAAVIVPSPAHAQRVASPLGTLNQLEVLYAAARIAGLGHDDLRIGGMGERIIRWAGERGLIAHALLMPPGVALNLPMQAGAVVTMPLTVGGCDTLGESIARQCVVAYSGYRSLRAYMHRLSLGSCLDTIFELRETDGFETACRSVDPRLLAEVVADFWPSGGLAGAVTQSRAVTGREPILYPSFATARPMACERLANIAAAISAGLPSPDREVIPIVSR